MSKDDKDFEITGVEAITAKFKLLETGFLNAIEKAVRQGVLDIEKDAKLMVPKITGRLGRSITSGITQKTVENVIGIAGANTVYAASVEYLHEGPGSGGGQRPYMRPARDKNMPQIIKHIEEALKTTIRGFNKEE